jgi:hypothetical protein
MTRAELLEEIKRLDELGLSDAEFFTRIHTELGLGFIALSELFSDCREREE